MTARYIAFEGGEGSGKSTQARRLAERVDALVTREPGGTPLGAELRRILLDVDGPSVGARAETLLMAADRAQHLVELVEPALAEGRHVISDRTAYSSLAYQGGGRQLGVDAVRAVNEWAIGGRWPDAVVLLDVEPEVAHRRLGSSRDRLEQETIEFHERVAAVFRSLADAEPDRWHVFDGSQNIEEVEAAVWRRLAPLFESDASVPKATSR